ncbi:MAG: response regulator transcription factor [Myxococcota bacterium]
MSLTHRPKIVVVEDDDEIRKALRDMLVSRGYAVESCANGDTGLKAVRSELYDLLILDLMLPDVNGLEVCRRVRAEQPDLPILILTSVESEDTILEGFQSGSDDYVTKPFRMAELFARVQALLRRATRNSVDMPQPFSFADWYVEPRALKASRGVEEMSLTERECDILALLVQHAGETVTRSQLLNRAWGFENPERIETRRVDVQMAKLRKKLGSPAGQAIETVHGSGYRYYYDEPKLKLEESRAPSTRAHSRKKVMWFARWATPDATGTGVIRDASPSGVFLSLDNPADLKKPTTERLWLQIYVPVGDPLEIEGIIKWSGWNNTHNGHGFGLLFGAANERLRALLHGRPDD